MTRSPEHCMWIHGTEKGWFMENLSDKIIDELVAIAFARATDYLFTQDGSLVIRDTAQLGEDAGAAIAGIERSTGGLKVKLYDKLKALELLGKCCGLFEGSQKPTEENNLLQVLLQATRKEMDLHDIPEAEPTAAADHDLVESAGT